MTKDELVTALTREIKALTSRFNADDYVSAVNDAERETWSLPQTTSFRILWLKSRAKRHLYSYLRDEAADKVDSEGYKTSQLFKQFSQLVKDFDVEFMVAVEENPDQFAGVDTYKLFGSQIDGGFSTDFLGRETTYGTDNEVNLTPDE